MSKTIIKIPILNIEDITNDFCYSITNQKLEETGIICSDSITNQKLEEIEIICSDYGNNEESLELINSISKIDSIKIVLRDKDFDENNLTDEAKSELIYFIKEYSFKEETLIFEIFKDLEKFLKENSLLEYYAHDFLRLKLKISKKFLEHAQGDYKENFYQIMRSDFINTDISNEIIKQLPLDLYRFFIWVLNEESHSNYLKFEMDVDKTHNYINKKEMNPLIESFTKIGINQDKQNGPFLIVTMTSFPARINDIHYTIYSLLNQTLKPDKLILWLAEEQFPKKEDDLPNELLKLKSNGLTIEWCDNIRSYKKLIPALMEYPADFLVTADDDIYYHETWLEDMWKKYEKNPNTIIASRARRIKFSSDGEIIPYNDWDLIKGKSETSYLNLPTGAGGTLYFPNALSNIVFEKSLFEEFCPTTDDLWFWAMAVLNKTKITCIDKPYYKLKYINIARDLHIINSPTLWDFNYAGNNDKQFNKLLEHFPEIKKIIIGNI